MSAPRRPRVAGGHAPTLVNLVLIIAVLIPAFVLTAGVQDVLLGRAAVRELPERIVHHAKDRWWVPLLYLFVAPFVTLLLRWLARRWPRARLRSSVVVAAPLAYALLFLFLFAGSAPDPAALVRALVPGLVAVTIHASVMRLPHGAPERPRSADDRR